MQLHNNGSSKFTSGRSFSISSKITILGGQIVTEVGDGIMLNSHNRTQHNLSSFLPAIFLVEKLYIYQFNLRNIFSKCERKTKCTCTMVLQVKKNLMRLYRDVETIKRQGGGNAHQGHLYRPTIMC